MLAAVSPMLSPMFRLPKEDCQNIQKDLDIKEDQSKEDKEGEDGGKKNENVSIVIVSHDNAVELEQHLPMFLSQKYDADFQVIVVADERDSETDDVIKRFSSDKHLYATFLPLSSRYISRKKLAITLGVKAAKHKWVIVTDAWCCPKDDNWLRAFVSHLNGYSDVVLGYSRYMEEAPAHYHYENIVNSSFNLRKAQSGSPYASPSRLVAVRKDVFLDNDGFVGNLMLTRGEYDFLANKFGANDKASTAVDADAFLLEDVPFKKRWSNNHLFAINTGRHLKGHWLTTTIRQIDASAMIITLLAIIGAIVYASIVQDWITLGAAIVALIINYVLTALVGQKAFRLFHCHVNAFLEPILAFTQPLRNIGWRIKYAFADKNDFITHKL